MKTRIGSPHGHLDSIHRGTHRRADGRFGDAVRLQDLGLSFGGRSAVAPHRGHDKRIAHSRFQIVAHLPDDERKVVDSAAAGRRLPDTVRLAVM
jgi:hypothetical protein